MRVTSKGQVTISIEVRQKAGLLPDTEVEFVVRGDTVIVRKVEKTPRRGQRLLTIMRGKASRRLSTDEIMALTRGN
ncbi:MAG: AbrB/MazE/SpoVT family DNA-binding domain-containing protein [Acidiferrobacterales bacterium]